MRNNFPRNAIARVGFTIIELVVATAVIGLLIALLLPAVQSTRSASQRVDCSSRMRQVALAVINYHDVHSAYPPGTGFKYSILPQLDLAAVYNARLPMTPGAGESIYDPIKNVRIVPYQCPADGHGVSSVSVANVVGCYGAGVLNYGFNGFLIARIVTGHSGHPHGLGTGTLSTATPMS